MKIGIIICKLSRIIKNITAYENTFYLISKFLIGKTKFITLVINNILEAYKHLINKIV